MILIKNLKKKYKNNLILDIDSFHFEKGKSYLVVGSNGSGKSTLIKCILGINRLDCGDIKVNTNNISYIPEKYYFPDFCTIDKFLLNILSLYSLEINKDLIDYYTSLFNIEKTRYLNKLSKGMQQKVLIIQSLIHNANLFIFDEPLNGLDVNSQNIFFDIIDKLKDGVNTVIITTHYPAFYKNKYDYIIKLNNRKLIYEDS